MRTGQPMRMAKLFESTGLRSSDEKASSDIEGFDSDFEVYEINHVENR